MAKCSRHKKIIHNKTLATHVQSNLYIGVPFLVMILLGVVVQTPAKGLAVILFLLPLFFLAWFILMFAMRCPSCDKGLALLSAKESYPFCPHCGARAFEDIPFREKLAQTIKNRKTVLPIERNKNEAPITVSWSPIDLSWETLWEKNSVKQQGNALYLKQRKRNFLLIVGILVILGIDSALYVDRSILGATFSKLLGFYLVASSFVLLYFLLSLLMLKIKTFDKATGYYFERARFYGEKETDENLQKFLLDDIVALQLTSTKAYNLTALISNPFITQYQLNLILKKGKRANILLSRHEEDVKQTAKMVADFLDVTVIYSLQETVFSEIYEEATFKNGNNKLTTVAD